MQTRDATAPPLSPVWQEQVWQEQVLTRPALPLLDLQPRACPKPWPDLARHLEFSAAVGNRGI
jgi:hypothetical protein